MESLEAYLLTGLVVCSLNTGLEGTAAHVSAFSLAETVVHETVSQANGLLGLCEHHLCDRA
jgi:hypothetical protein